MKWAVLGYKIFSPRYQALHEFLTQEGIANELSLIECEPLNFAERLPEVLKEFEQIRIESPYREQILSQFKSQGMLVASIGAADCLVQTDGQWWPQVTLFHAFNELFSRYGSRLDLAADVLIVGSGASCKIAVAAAVRAGFARINISTKFDDQGIEAIADLKKRYFAVQFEFVPQDRLVLLPGTNALLINTTPIAPTNDLLAELHYLNFLRPDGMIWDLVVSPGTTPLIKEGEQINIQSVRGREIAALADQKWLEWIGGRSLDVQKLESHYKKIFHD